MSKKLKSQKTCTSVVGASNIKLIFFHFVFKLELRLLIERTCMYGWMSGANSDNAVSIPTIVTWTMMSQTRGQTFLLVTGCT